MAQPTDIVIIVSNHHRWDMMFNNGCQLAYTPNFDALAAAGTSFRRAATVFPEAENAYASLVSGAYPNGDAGAFAASAMGTMLAGRDFEVVEVAARQQLLATVEAAGAAIAAPVDGSRVLLIRLPAIWSFEDIPERCFAPYRGNGVPLATYFAAVTAYDDAIGEMLSAIDGTGRRQSTLVIYTSLSGEQFKARDFVNHANTLHADSIRVPLILSWPELTSGGAVSDAFVSHVDLYATLASCTGSDLPTTGVNLLDCGRASRPGEEQRQGIYLYNHHQRHIDFVFKDGSTDFVIFPPWVQRGLWTGRYKLILSDDGGICRFFDLQIDPEEEFNLFAVPQGTSQGLLDQFTSRRTAIVSVAEQLAAEARRLGDNLGVELAGRVISDPTYGSNPTYERI